MIEAKLVKGAYPAWPPSWVPPTDGKVYAIESRARDVLFRLLGPRLSWLPGRVVQVSDDLFRTNRIMPFNSPGVIHVIAA